MKIEGSVAVITGAASGLGLATAPKEPQDPTDEERGLIVNTASVAAFEGQVGQAAYSASNRSRT